MLWLYEWGCCLISRGFCSLTSTGKYGIEVNALVCAESGFRVGGEINHNRALGGNSGMAITFRLLVKAKILGERVVNGKREYYNIRGSWFTICMDRKFTSLALAFKLYSLKIMVIGTCKTNQYDWPAEMRPKEMKKLPIGTTRHAFLKNGPVVAMAWCCKADGKATKAVKSKVVYILTTMDEFQYGREFSYMVPGNEQTKRPGMVLAYNQRKPFVDKLNQQLR